jgi:hypothetical protein
VSDDPVFGPLKGAIDVREAVKATIEEWIETYLARVEKHYGLKPRTIQTPRSYVFADDGSLNKRPEKQLPCVLITCTGTKGDARREGDGTYRAPWSVGVGVLVSSKDQLSSSNLAQWYSTAIMALMVHNGTLGGFAEATTWRGQRNDDLKPEQNRTLAAGTNVFEVLVPEVVRKGAGLKAPPEDPYEDVQPYEITEVDIDLQPEEIQ